MIVRDIAGLAFELVGPVLPQADANGRVIELWPQSRYRNIKELPLNRYGQGPFCRFRVARGDKRRGLYVVTIDDESVYVGQCANLDIRWGSQYGTISPKNCFKGGQETNCRINNLILGVAKRHKIIILHFCAIPEGDLNVPEVKLISTLCPAWNLAGLTKIRPTTLDQ